jgi:hypothetical protein
MSFKLESNTDNVVARIGAIDDRIRASLLTAVEALKDELVDKIKARTPVRTGALRDSISGRVTSGPTGVTATVGANPTGGESKGSRRDFYAIFIEYGATIPPHKILPDVKQALHFGDVFARAVNAPGGTVEAQEMVHGAFKDMRKKIVSDLKGAVNKKL